MDGDHPGVSPPLPAPDRLLGTQHPAVPEQWANEFQAPTSSLSLSGTAVGQSQSSVNVHLSLEHYATKGSHVLQDHPSVHTPAGVDSAKAKRMMRMAKDLINIKKNEFALFIPRHIFHEDDELFVVRDPPQVTNPKPQRIPPRLMTIPRDANYLVEVFFEVSQITDNQQQTKRKISELGCLWYCVLPFLPILIPTYAAG